MAVFRRKSRDGSLSKYFSYDFWVAGRRYRGVIKGARTRAQAQRSETKLRDSVYEGGYGKTVEAQTLSMFVTETYLPHSKLHKRSSQHDEFRPRPPLAALGRFRLDEVWQVQTERYKRGRRAADSRRGEGYAPASVNRELEPLSAVFTHAIRLEPLPGPKPLPRGGAARRGQGEDAPPLPRGGGAGDGATGGPAGATSARSSSWLFRRRSAGRNCSACGRRTPTSTAT